MYVTFAADSSPSSDTDHFQLGDRVLVGGMKPGIILFIGEVHFSPGDWAGVVLDSPTGKNDGRVGAHRYFTCEPKRGVFCRLGKLTKLPAGASPVASVDSGSTTQLEKNNSANQYGSNKSDTVPSSLPKVADSQLPTVVVEKPSSPSESGGSHQSDHGIPSPLVQTSSTNHNDGNDDITARFYFFQFFWCFHQHSMAGDIMFSGCSCIHLRHSARPKRC